MQSQGKISPTLPSQFQSNLTILIEPTLRTTNHSAFSSVSPPSDSPSESHPTHPPLSPSHPSPLIKFHYIPPSSSYTLEYYTHIIHVYLCTLLYLTTPTPTLHILIHPPPIFMYMPYHLSPGSEFSSKAHNWRMYPLKTACSIGNQDRGSVRMRRSQKLLAFDSVL